VKILPTIISVLFWSLLACLCAELFLTVKESRQAERDSRREMDRKREERIVDLDERITNLEAKGA